MRGHARFLTASFEAFFIEEMIGGLVPFMALQK
jgi:hypothetical protein